MKFATAWWGVQILAENDDDAELLRKLIDKLPSTTVNSYNEGELRIISEDDCDETWGFSAEEVKAAKLAIEFAR